MRIGLLLLSSLLVFASCEQWSFLQKDNHSDNQHPVTLEASNISAFKATLNGSLPLDVDAEPTEVWFLSCPSAVSLETLLAEGTSLEAVLHPDGSFDAKTVSLDMDAQYSYVACARLHGEDLFGEVKTFTTQTREAPEGAVELGLSVMWGSCNLGSTVPEDYGHYYAWGETEPKEDYTWETYLLCRGSYNTLTKYCTDGDYGAVDNKTILELEDDAAHARLGGNWRMPTDEEWTELQRQCTWTWTSINGVSGYKVTSRKPGYTDNWIFLPAAGHRHGEDHFDYGSYGLYWSSSLSERDSYDAWYVYFYDSHVTRRSYYYYDRYLGRSIRPVAE